MKKYWMKSLAVLVLSVFVISCGRQECTNENPVFNSFAPETKEYKTELVNQLQRMDKSTLTYWFDKYQKTGEQEYIHVSIKGGGLCAKGVMAVKQWGKLADIQKTKGAGYSGAELRNLQFDIQQNDAGTELVYKSVDEIID
jgi:hypothetical protein